MAEDLNKYEALQNDPEYRKMRADFVRQYAGPENILEQIVQGFKKDDSFKALPLRMKLGDSEEATYAFFRNPVFVGDRRSEIAQGFLEDMDKKLPAAAKALGLNTLPPSAKAWRDGLQRDAQQDWAKFLARKAGPQAIFDEAFAPAIEAKLFAGRPKEPPAPPPVPLPPVAAAGAAAAPNKIQAQPPNLPVSAPVAVTRLPPIVTKLPTKPAVAKFPVKPKPGARPLDLHPIPLPTPVRAPDPKAGTAAKNGPIKPLTQPVKISRSCLDHPPHHRRRHHHRHYHHSRQWKLRHPHKAWHGRGSPRSLLPRPLPSS